MLISYVFHCFSLQNSVLELVVGAWPSSANLRLEVNARPQRVHEAVGHGPTEADAHRIGHLAHQQASGEPIWAPTQEMVCVG